MSYANYLNALIYKHPLKEWLSKNIVCWNVTETTCISAWIKTASHVNCEGIWDGIKENQVLPKNYISQQESWIDRLLVLAGVRTALLLEELYQYRTKISIIL
jgi:hypothetical protein